MEYIQEAGSLVAIILPTQHTQQTLVLAGSDKSRKKITFLVGAEYEYLITFFLEEEILKTMFPLNHES